jgi:hypothetical protein
MCLITQPAEAVREDGINASLCRFYRGDLVVPQAVAIEAIQPQEQTKH